MQPWNGSAEDLVRSTVISDLQFNYHVAQHALGMPRIPRLTWLPGRLSCSYSVQPPPDVSRLGMCVR